jgi:hypothetical protein
LKATHIFADVAATTKKTSRLDDRMPTLETRKTVAGIKEKENYEKLNKELNGQFYVY